MSGYPYSPSQLGVRPAAALSAAVPDPGILLDVRRPAADGRREPGSCPAARRSCSSSRPARGCCSCSASSGLVIAISAAINRISATVGLGPVPRVRGERRADRRPHRHDLHRRIRDDRVLLGGGDVRRGGDLRRDDEALARRSRRHPFHGPHRPHRGHGREHLPGLEHDRLGHLDRSAWRHVHGAHRVRRPAHPAPATSRPGPVRWRRARSSARSVCTSTSSTSSCSSCACSAAPGTDPAAGPVAAATGSARTAHRNRPGPLTAGHRAVSSAPLGTDRHLVTACARGADHRDWSISSHSRVAVSPFGRFWGRAVHE
jgi:hypothetical protein